MRALTLDAAGIAGMGSRLGSINQGKIANLVITDGNIFDERTKIVRVFIDGRPVAIDTPASADGRRGPSR